VTVFDIYIGLQYIYFISAVKLITNRTAEQASPDKSVNPYGCPAPQRQSSDDVTLSKYSVLPKQPCHAIGAALCQYCNVMKLVLLL